MASGTGRYNFCVPSEEQQRKACGWSILDRNRLFEPVPELFPCIPKPERGSWLFEHSELGQSFADYCKSGIRPVKSSDRIYLQPLGDFPAGASPNVDMLAAFSSIYFGVPVIVLPGVDMQRPASASASAKRWFTPVTAQTRTGAKKYRVQTRVKSRAVQYDINHIFAVLLDIKPKDAYCIMGITMTDLYPEESWNFVFGAADPAQGTGVFSFARDSPLFPDVGRRKLTSEEQSQMLKRSLHTLIHEILHLFKMDHCIYFSCILNGSNHQEESDTQPLHICPCDLRKLQHVTSFDVIERELKLEQAYAAMASALSILEPDVQAELALQLSRISRGLPLELPASPPPTIGMFAECLAWTRRRLAYLQSAPTSSSSDVCSDDV